MASKLITPPAAEPVTLAEFRDHLRGVGDSDDTLSRIITAARELVELETRRALINQTWLLSLDTWPRTAGGLGWWDGVQEGSILADQSGSVELPRAPLVSITSVKTARSDGTQDTFASTSYYADTASVPGRAALNGGASWPVPGRSVAGIEIEYVAGYGATPANVPAALRTAILQIGAHWYENREIVDFESSATRLPMQAGRLIERFRVMAI